VVSKAGCVQPPSPKGGPMEKVKKELPELSRNELFWGREALAKLLMGIDAALAAPELQREADEVIREASELREVLPTLKSERDSLKREIENRQEELDGVNAKLQKANTDWEAFQRKLH